MREKVKIPVQQILPEEIEKRSFEIIEEELTVKIDPELKPIVKRVIHTTADFSYAESMCFSNNVLEKAKEAIQSGAVIVTDTNMTKAGINQKALEKYGNKVICYMAEDTVEEKAKQQGVTRAAVSVEEAAKLGDNMIYSVGNAPTALIRLYEMIQEGTIHPKLIIGVPVGFVNVVEAKELILSTDVPYIVARGRKGGSNVAAAICNALLRLA